MPNGQTTEPRRHGVGTEPPSREPFTGLHADLTERILACAIEVHRQLGPGLLESVYEGALKVELAHSGLRYRRQVSYPVLYRGEPVGEHRIDLIVEDAVVVELKTVHRLDPVFDAQVLTYLRLSGLKVGLLINFHSRTLREGIRRFIL
ncbi:MAG TPA: GxxExxY protein [Vicinamibacteria bacterium]|nr:GxxExxY protein [Vicinamibacteria bacterium]